MTQPSRTTDESTRIAVMAFMIIPLTVLVLFTVLYNLAAAG